MPTSSVTKNPSVIGDERIARGSGQNKEHVRGLLDRFFAMQKVMKQLADGLHRTRRVALGLGVTAGARGNPQRRPRARPWMTV
jgi:signal recognition particle GTPase